MISKTMVRKQGFTLIELSIVIVIIALIVGAVIIGRDLVRSANLRIIIREQEGFKTAINTFRLKYGQLPGDMKNAESMWGSDAGCPFGGTDTTPHIPTCNGNGDGLIEGVTGQSHERLRVWQHLSNAALLPYQYSGNRGAGQIFNIPNKVIGLSVPQSAANALNAGWDLRNPNASFSRSAFSPTYNYRELLEFGRDNPDRTTLDPTLTTTDGFAIDSKMDDGNPVSGFVQINYIIVYHSGPGATAPGSCFYTDGPPNYVDHYDTLATGNRCVMVFPITF